MWVSAAGAALSYFSASKKAKTDWKHDKEKLALEAMYGRENSQFDAEQAYYYKQLQRAEAKRGLDEFRKFSTVGNFAPDYHNDNPGPVMPTKPTYNQATYSNTTGKK